MKKKKQILYSLADWKAHKNKLGYDDLVDEANNLIVTIGVMDIALDEILSPSLIEDKYDQPKALFVMDNNLTWDIFLNVKWLTPKNIRGVLKKFGNLVGKEFIFKPYELPRGIKEKLDKKIEKWEKEIKEITSADIKRSAEFMKKMKKDADAYKKKKAGEQPKKVPNKRLIEIITHKLKF